MKVRFFSEDGCSGSVDEVIFFPDEFLEGKNLALFMRGFTSYFGCSECVEWGKVEDSTPHQREAYKNKKWREILLREV
ncbi:hypothetical protein D3C85_885610 [compost metagenome]